MCGVRGGITVIRKEVQCQRTGRGAGWEDLGIVRLELQLGMPRRVLEMLVVVVAQWREHTQYQQTILLKMVKMGSFM